MTTTQTDRLLGVTTSLALKAPVKAATTANITLSGEQTIDGIAVVEGDRVLVKNQTDAKENGIYDVGVSSWPRSKDFDGDRDVVTGTRVYIAAGTTYEGREACVTTTGEITIGTSEITFSILSVIDGIVSIAAGDGISVDDSTPSEPVVAINVSGLTEAVVASGDSFVFADVSASGVLRRDTVQGIIDRVLPSQTSNSGKALITDGTDESWGYPAMLSTTSGAAPSYTVRAWVNFDASSGTPTIKGSENVSSLTDNGVGNHTINLTAAPRADAYFSCVASATGHQVAILSQADSVSCRISVKSSGGTDSDTAINNVMVVG